MTGPAQGQPHGRVLLVRRSYLPTLEAVLAKHAAMDSANTIPPDFYDGMAQDRVKVQLTVFSSDPLTQEP